MPPDTVKARGESNIVWNFMRLVEDGVVSQEKLVTLIGDIYGSQYVTLRGANGAALDLLTGIILAAGDNNIGNVDVLTTAITKTIQTELLAPTLVAANAQQLSAELDLANIKKATIYIDHGRTAVTAFVGAGTEYRIEGSQKATGNDTWRTIASVECIITLATAITADGNEAAGTTVIDIGANTPAVGDIVFWRNGTLALSEWMKVVAITGGTDFTIQDGLTNPQLAAQLIYNKAEQFVLTLDVNSFTRLRVVANNNNGTTNVGVISRVAAITQE